VDSTYFLEKSTIWLDEILRNNNYTKSHIKKKLLWKVQQTFHLFIELDDGKIFTGKPYI
jgi:hypothetical protein